MLARGGVGCDACVTCLCVSKYCANPEILHALGTKGRGRSHRGVSLISILLSLVFVHV